MPLEDLDVKALVAQHLGGLADELHEDKETLTATPAIGIDL